MAKKISELVAVTDVQDTDELVLARAGTTNKITGANAKAAFGGSSSFTEPVSVTITDESAGHALNLYNSAWDTDPTDPVLSVGVTDDGFAGLYLHNNTGGVPAVDLTNRNGTQGVQINVAFVLVQDVPADGQLLNGQLAIGFDQTEGAAKVHFKAKDIAGNVVTASIDLT